jgi:hypothetical protein
LDADERSRRKQLQDIQCVQTVRAIWAAPDLVRGITSLVGLTRSTAGFMTS